MSKRDSGFGRCLRFLIFVGAAVVVVVSGANRAHAESNELISPLSNITGPVDSSPSADYVRRPTDPPRFDADSPAAKAARARAAAAAPAKPVQPKSKTKHGDNVDVGPSGDRGMPPSEDSTSRWPAGDSTKTRQSAGDSRHAGRSITQRRRGGRRTARRRAGRPTAPAPTRHRGGRPVRRPPRSRRPARSPPRSRLLSHRRLPAPRATRRCSCRRRRSRRSITWSPRRPRRHPRRSRRRWRP